MSWGKIRGAPRRLPADEHDLFDSSIDVAARTAWLLRVSRMASPWGARTADSFVRRLAEVGYPIKHGSQVSQWESGRFTAPLALVAAYERALSLAPAELLGAVASMQQTYRVTVAEPIPDDRDQLFTQISMLDEAIAEGTATGHDWLTLVILITDPRITPRPRGTARLMAHGLTTEMLRAGHFDYSSRWAALSILLGDSLYQELAEQEIVAVAQQPGAPLARNAWAALSQSTRKGVAATLIEQFVSGDDERVLGVSFGLATMIGRRQLGGQDVEALQDRLQVMAREGSPQDRDIAYSLAGRLGGRTMAAVGHPPPAQWSQRGFVERPPHYDDYLAAVREASGLDDDPIIDRLLQEALSNLWLEKRQLAQELIGASPYRDAVARTAIHVATTSAVGQARRSASNLLRQITPDDQSLLRRLLFATDPKVVSDGLIAIGRGGALDRAALAPFLDDPTTREDALMAAGMLGHTGVAATDEEQVAADWWARGGGRRTTPGTPVGG